MSISPIALSNFNIDTYKALTANSILGYANVRLSFEDLSLQLKAQGTFYRSLIELPSLVVFNSLINGQCRDLQTYSQERLIEYILSGQEQKMVSASETELKNKIEEQRLELIKQGEALTELETSHYQLMLDTYILQEKQTIQWHEEINKHVEPLWAAIELCQEGIPILWKARLLELMKTQAPGVVIPDDLLKRVKIQEGLPVIKAVLRVFIEFNREVNLNNLGKDIAKKEPCLEVMKQAHLVDEALKTLQIQLETERKETLLPQIIQKEKTLKEMRQTMFDLRQNIAGLLSMVTSDENAFHASPDMEVVNQEMNVNLSLQHA